MDLSCERTDFNLVRVEFRFRTWALRTSQVFSEVFEISRMCSELSRSTFIYFVIFFMIR